MAPCVEPTRPTPAFAGEMGQVCSVAVMQTAATTVPFSEPAQMAVLFRGGGLVCALGQGRAGVAPWRMEAGEVTRGARGTRDAEDAIVPKDPRWANAKWTNGPMRL